MELEVIVGSYEHFVLGYTVKEEDPDDNGKIEYTAKLSFTNNSHSASISALSTIGKYLVSGSSDEVMRIFNLESRLEHGSLQKQSGTITCMTNFEKNFLFSASEDGTICIWKSGNWQCEKTLNAHQGGVIDVDVHPSGKLALSVGKDRSLKTWNLIKGRSGYITNLKGIADAVRWSTDGKYYAVSIANRVDIYSIQNAEIEYSIPFGKRASCLAFSPDDIIIVAGDKETIEVHSISQKAQLTSFDAHKNRVKAIALLPNKQILVTASNDGFIKMWSFGEGEFSSKPTLLKEIDTTCRITCMTLFCEKTVSASSVKK